MGLGLARTAEAASGQVGGRDQHYATVWDANPGLLSYQFQVGATLSEAITTENQSSKVGVGPNTGQAFHEEWLRAIGAVNGNAANVEYWGSEVDARCKKFEGGKLLETFLCKRFCMVYDGEKLIGDENIETGTSTMGGKDIVLDLRFQTEFAQDIAAAPTYSQCSSKRAMFLIQYHSQLHVRENEVVASY